MLGKAARESWWIVKIEAVSHPPWQALPEGTESAHSISRNYARLFLRQDLFGFDSQ